MMCTPGWYTAPRYHNNFTWNYLIIYIHLLLCWKFPQARRSEADNFGGGPGTFCWFYFNFMFMIWDSRHEDLQLFLLSFKHCYYYHTNIMQISMSWIICQNRAAIWLLMLAWREHSSRPVYIISVLGQSAPAGMSCQHDIIFMLSHLYPDFLWKYT